jgi:SNF2 family DNA or RNA helicase
LSLKAGNAGITLTEANYVFLIDPWWNRQVEQQAIDRVYRIGQDKNVFAYRMICKDTIEEKIIKLQQSKLSLSEELISEDDGFVKNLSENDLEFLFE